MTRDVMAEIEQEVKDAPVLLYMKGNKLMPQCGFSAAVVAVLMDLDVPFREVDILRDEEKRQAIKQYSEWPTIPQLYVGGQFVGGCDIVREMQAKGELGPMIHKALAEP